MPELSDDATRPFRDWRHLSVSRCMWRSVLRQLIPLYSVSHQQQLLQTHYIRPWPVRCPIIPKRRYSVAVFICLRLSLIQFPIKTRFGQENWHCCVPTPVSLLYTSCCSIATKFKVSPVPYKPFVLMWAEATGAWSCPDLVPAKSQFLFAVLHRPTNQASI